MTSTQHPAGARPDAQRQRRAVGSFSVMSDGADPAEGRRRTLCLGTESCVLGSGFRGATSRRSRLKSGRPFAVTGGATPPGTISTRPADAGLAQCRHPGLVAQPWQTRRAQNTEVVGSNPTGSIRNFAEERQRRPRLAHNQEPAGSSPASAIRPVLPTAGCLAHIETMGVQLPHRALLIRGCGGSGRHTRLRAGRRKAWRFDSSQPH